MTGASVSPRNEKVAVKCKSSPLQKASFEFFDFKYTDITPSEDGKCTLSKSDPQSSKLLSTTDLISALGYAWGCARKPLSVLLSQSKSTSDPEFIQEAAILHYSIDEGTYCAYTSTGNQASSNYYVNHKANSAAFVEENQELSSVDQNQHSYESFSFWSIVLSRSTVIERSSKENYLLSKGIPSTLGTMYLWMNENSIYKSKNQLTSIEVESKRTTNSCIGYCSTLSGSGRVPLDKTSTSNCLTTGFSASNPEAAEAMNLSFGSAASFDSKQSTPTYTENDIVNNIHIEGNNCEISTLRCDGDTQETKLASCTYVHDDCIIKSGNTLHEDQEDEGIMFVKADSSELEISTSHKEKPLYALAKQEHALAGAMAGIFVSLCLHPVDTIKTVIQSCHYDQKLLISRSIIAERGISGLYRGISSNILSSAPISALYTFTYESVKKNLLPLLPKEYHSLAHCTAGGCASVATSFIFTPSERIKQQMQVGSHYRNCWNALIHVIQNGGVPSLYAGWGAVLCRNVPHSVIKFYTYESLKQIMLPSNQWNAQANILTTLVCGGLAGSMASLFTTPFDVVKTRMQTQIPGSMVKHSGVLNTLAEIGKHEGLNGLYRGLTPRLVMYMIQGALFFASYESLKRLFSLEFLGLTPNIRHEQKIEDNSTTLPSTISVTA